MYQLNPLFESTVARRLVDQGIITDPKKIKMMIRKGWIPSKKKTIRGLRRSVSNIAKKHGYKIQTRGNRVIDSLTIPLDTPIDQLKPQLDMMGIGAKLKPGTIYIPHDPSRYTIKRSKMTGTDPLRSAIISWHEGREVARSAQRTGKRWRKFATDTSSNSDVIAKVSNLDRDKRTQLAKHSANFSHAPGVMRDEAKLSNSLKRRYGIDFQNDVVHGISRNPVERELGTKTAKQDLTYRLNSYKDQLSKLGITP